MRDLEGKTEKEMIELSLAEMENAAAMMRKALLSRRQDAIMASVEHQELLMKQFEGIWNVKPYDKGEGAESLRAAAVRIKRMFRRNAVIARTFLDLIRGTIESLNAGAGRQSCSYDETGRASSRGAVPLLVQCQG
jgi:hypothetical protein